MGVSPRAEQALWLVPAGLAQDSSEIQLLLFCTQRCGSFLSGVLILSLSFPIGTKCRHVTICKYCCLLEYVEHSIKLPSEPVVQMLEDSAIHPSPHCRPVFLQPSNRGDTDKVVPRTVYTKSKGSTAHHTLTCAKILPINCLSKV